MAQEIQSFNSDTPPDTVADDGVPFHEPLPEFFLHGLWMKRRYDESGMHTVDGIAVQVTRPGRYNRYEKGPDFRSSLVRLGGEVYSGDIECHIRSVDWMRHGHDTDPEYDNVILHVSLLDDDVTGTLRKSDGSFIPEIVLYPFLDQNLRSLLHGFRTQTEAHFPCAFHWNSVPPGIIRPYTRQLASERLSERIYRISREHTGGLDWDNILYRRVMTAMGYTENAAGMAELARRVPLQRLQELPDAFHIEAVLFGVAGLLPDLSEIRDTDRKTADYVVSLRDRFTSLAQNCTSSPMENRKWHFRGLRPSNFPHRRIAQVARLVHESGLLGPQPIDRIIDSMAAIKPIRSIMNLMEVGDSSFWSYHLHLRHECQIQSFSVGKERVHIVLTDAILPVIAAFSESNGFEAIRRRAESILQKLPARKNRITQPYLHPGYRPSTLWEAQGLHQLATTRCASAACMQCRIGSFVLKKQ